MKSGKEARGKDKDFLMKALIMSGSSYKGKKKIKIIVTAILISLWVTSLYSGRAAVFADWGDVVDLNYSLWTDAAHTQPVEGNINADLPNIYIGVGSTVPPKILARFPDALATLLESFKRELVGIELNKEKEFVIPSTEHSYEGVLAGKDLYYLVRITKIRYDASEGEISEPTSTTKRNPGELDTLTIIGGGLGIITVSVLFWGFSNQRRRQKVLGQDSTSTVRQEKSIKHKKTQLKELRELAESHSSDTDVKETSKTDVKFRRRR